MSMPVDTLEPAFFEAHVAKAKAAWRKYAQSLSWEEKVAAIERMWQRDAALKVARESLEPASGRRGKPDAA